MESITDNATSIAGCSFQLDKRSLQKDHKDEYECLRKFQPFTEEFAVKKNGSQQFTEAYNVLINQSDDIQNN